jgi:hypothetical protein
LAFAKGGPATIEAEIRAQFDRFGAAAVYGGIVPVHLLRRLVLSEAIEIAQKQYMAAPNGVEWIQANPVLWNILKDAIKASNE